MSLPDLIGLGEGFPQPVVFPPASSGSPQPVGASLDFPQAAVPLSTVGLVGEAAPQPEGPQKAQVIQAFEKGGNLAIWQRKVQSDKEK